MTPDDGHTEFTIQNSQFTIQNSLFPARGLDDLKAGDARPGQGKHEEGYPQERPAHGAPQFKESLPRIVLLRLADLIGMGEIPMSKTGPAHQRHDESNEGQRHLSIADRPPGRQRAGAGHGQIGRHTTPGFRTAEGPGCSESQI